MTREPAIAFSSQLRSARLAALGDAEAFDGIIHVIERLGSYLAKETFGDKGENGSLGLYSSALNGLAAHSELAAHRDFANLLTPFCRLYELVTAARNDALHQGAFARHLTKHAIDLSIVLEDALSTYMDLVVMDFMIRNPVCAELWQPLGFIRQQLLANSYSYLPVRGGDQSWRMISDAKIATFLGAERKGKKRRRLLASIVGDLWDSLQRRNSSMREIRSTRLWHVS